MRLLKIGREAGNDIVLHSDKVSSLHAEITLLDSGDIQLEDKNSRNGTYIMNQRIAPGKPVNIRRGDAIRFADVELQWSQIPMPEDNSAYKAIYGIGSNFQNDLQISGATVSRYHATIKIGRDKKVYIVDHSKNGTTVNSVKITPNQPYRIKRSSKVVCGGVPVDTSRIPWPTNPWKWVAGIAAALVIVAGVGFGVWKFALNSPKAYDDGELYAMYHNSVVMLMGIYHYELSIDGVDIDKDFPNFPLYKRFIRTQEGRFSPVPDAYAEELIPKYGLYTGTGFFISKDGKILTNLHVAKPWLSGDIRKNIEAEVKQAYAKWATEQDFKGVIFQGGTTPYTAFTSLIKVNGVLDGIVMIPQGRYLSSENMVECRTISAGDDINVDVALLQSEKGELPPGARYINVQDSIDISDDAYTVGSHVYTIGFPAGINLQNLKSENGMQVYAQGGDIIRKDDLYEFSYNAATTGGASGSPVFNKYGMLIGIHHAGASKALTQGYNEGIKAQYIKDIIENPHIVN